MNMPRTIKQWLPALVLLALAACQSGDGGQVVYSGPEPEQVQPEPAPEPVYSAEFLRARLLADMLYEARLAWEDNRLMTPAGNNAYDRYREVLSIDPGNEVARQGIIDVALRYVELADLAIGQAQYDNAASLLARGERASPGLPALEEARQRLARARENPVETFALDPGGLSSQSVEMLNRLSEIAHYIRDRELTFLINARNDAEGRWIYKIMREAVGGYRLRGDIAIAATPAVVVAPPPG